MSIVVPKPGEPLVEEDRLPTKPWYNYLTQNANALANVTTVTTADITSAINAVSTEFKINSGTVAITTGQTEHNFTGIPSSVKRLTISFDNVGLTSVGSVLVRIGTSTALVSTGYNANSIRATSAVTLSTASTSGFVVMMQSSAPTLNGHMTIMRITSHTWVQSHHGAFSTVGGIVGGGRVPLGGELERVSILTNDTANNVFRSGQANIHWEF